MITTKPERFGAFRSSVRQFLNILSSIFSVFLAILCPVFALLVLMDHNFEMIIAKKLSVARNYQSQKVRRTTYKTAHLCSSAVQQSNYVVNWWNALFFYCTASNLLLTVAYLTEILTFLNSYVPSLVLKQCSPVNQQILLVNFISVSKHRLVLAETEQ